VSQEKNLSVYAEFYRKAVDRRELKDSLFPGEKWKVQVEQVVELSPDEYDVFAENLCEYHTFIETNAGNVYFDEQEECAHCLLVTAPEQKEGILVVTEGYFYARYAAYIPDCSVLDLADISDQASMTEQKIKSAKFYFRITDMIHLKECPIDREPEPFEIIRRFCLPGWKFREFASDLARRNPWLNRPEQAALYYEIGENRKCVAVTTDTSREAVLVDTQGYDYARICAYIPDYHRLELSGVPVTYYNGIKETEGKQPFTETAVFYRGANTLYAIDDGNPHSHEDSFQIEKQVILTDTDYAEFASNMKEDYEFLFSNHRFMYYEPDRKRWHCLLVTGEHAAGGILVDSEGYSHAEYSALILDKEKLDLSGIPIESYLPGQHTEKMCQGDNRGKEKDTERREER
jgi:hypothetical protein